MDLEYIKKVQEWVEIDNKILKSKEENNEIINKKKILEESIIQYVEENNLDNFSLNISDGSIKFSKKTQTQPLSIKIVKQQLEDYSKQKNISLNIDEICNHILSNLEKKNQIYMKRNIK